MKIGNNVKVLDKFYYNHLQKLYVGQVGTIKVTSTTKIKNPEGESVQHEVKFTDGKKLWWFEQELETNDQAQKSKCVKDCLENDDETKRPFLMAALTLCLWRLHYEFRN